MKRQATGWDDTVHMRMELQLLIPGVQHAEKTNLGTEMSWGASHFEESLCARAQQQTVDEFLVLQGQRS